MQVFFFFPDPKDSGMCDAFFFSSFPFVLAYGLQAQYKSTNLADLFETSHLRNGFFFFPFFSNPGLNKPPHTCKTDILEFVSFRFIQVASREWSVEGRTEIETRRVQIV